MKKEHLWLPLMFFVLAAFVLPSASHCAPYYEHKVIRMISGSEPGGNYDRMARLLARYLPKYLPGKPTIIIENMPGAGSLIAANQIYSKAAPDGLTIGAPQRGIPFAQLTKSEGAKFDVRKFAWIGSASVEPMVFAIRADHPYKNILELKKIKDPLFVPGAGPGASDYQFTYLLKEFLGLNLKSVTYTSGTAGRLALLRKEVDATAGSYSSVKPFIDQGAVRPLVRSRVSQAGIENLPVDEDLTTDSTGKVIMAMRTASDRIARPYIAPPATPAPVIKILRDAFAQVAKDKDLIAEAKKYNLEIEYIPAEECLKTLNYMFNQPDRIIKEFGKYIQF